jgi:hypothetical protein
MATKQNDKSVLRSRIQKAIGAVEQARMELDEILCELNESEDGDSEPRGFLVVVADSPRRVAFWSKKDWENQGQIGREWGVINSYDPPFIFATKEEAQACIKAWYEEYKRSGSEHLRLVVCPFTVPELDALTARTQGSREW